MIASYSVLRRFTAVAFACLIASAGLLGVGAPAALAGRGWVFSGYFGSKGGGKAQFESPQGTAVNEATGDVYVADSSANRVEWFDAEGNYIGQFNGGGTFEVKGKIETGPAAPSGTLLQPTGIAVDNACAEHNPALTESTLPTCREYDPSSGDVYVTDVGHHVIDKFSASGEYLGDITETRSFTEAETSPCELREPVYGEYKPFRKSRWNSSRSARPCVRVSRREGNVRQLDGHVYPRIDLHLTASQWVHRPEMR